MTQVGQADLFDAILADAGIDVVLSGVRTPRMNSIVERWVQTCRRELLDRTLIWNQRHLLHALHDDPSLRAALQSQSMDPLEPLRPVEPLNVPGPRPRPSRTVRAASILLVVAAPLTAATVVLSLFDGSYAEQTYLNAVDQGLIENETSFAAVGVTAQLCCSVVGLAVAAAFLVFARQAWSARNTVRIWIWATGGLVLVCFGLPAGFASAHDGVRGAISAYPPWFVPVFRATGLTMCTCLLTAIILLATRAANGFFRPAGRRTRQQRTADHSS